MKFKKSLLALITPLFFIACGDNTLEHITSDIKNLQIDQEDRISIYSTDKLSLSSTVYYEDNTSADASNSVTWENSDYNVTTLDNNIIIPSANSGEANITALYKDISDAVTIKVIGLVDVNSSWDITSNDINITGDFTLTAHGDFVDGVTDKLLTQNITWESTNDSNISISDDDVATLHVFNTGEMNVTATLFDVNITKTYIIE